MEKSCDNFYSSAFCRTRVDIRLKVHHCSDPRSPFFLHYSEQSHIANLLFVNTRLPSPTNVVQLLSRPTTCDSTSLRSRCGVENTRASATQSQMKLARRSPSLRSLVGGLAHDLLFLGEGPCTGLRAVSPKFLSRARYLRVQHVQKLHRCSGTALIASEANGHHFSHYLNIANLVRQEFLLSLAQFTFHSYTKAVGPGDGRFSGTPSA